MNTIDRLSSKPPSAPRKEREPRLQFIAGPNPNGLSVAQYEVLMHLAEGLSQAEIADALCISTQTVATHVLRAKERMNAATTIHAAVMWDRHVRGAA